MGRGRSLKGQSRLYAELSKMSVIKNISQNDNPYIHNRVEHFEKGYKTIQSVVDNFIYDSFVQYKKEFGKYVPLLRKAEAQAYQMLGLNSIKDLNQAYSVYVKENQTGNSFFEVLNIFRQFKHGIWDIRIAPTDVNSTTNKKDLESLFRDNITHSLQATLEQLKLQNADTDFITGLSSLIAIMNGTGKGNYIFMIGNIAEKAMDLGFNQLVNDYASHCMMPSVIKSIRYLNRDQKDNTKDIGWRTEQGEILFSLKTGAGLDSQGMYSDIFTDTRGYNYNYKKGNEEGAASKYTIPNAFNLAGADNSVEYQLLQYVIYNHKVLNLSHFVEGTLQTLKFGLAWLNLLNAIFGNSFRQEMANGSNIMQFPIFLMTLDRIIPMSDLCNYFAQLGFADIKNIIQASDNNDRFRIQSLSAKSEMENLLQQKHTISINKGSVKQSSKKKQNRNAGVSYQEMYSELLKNGRLTGINNKNKSQLTYRVKYRLALSNVAQLV